MLFQKEGNEKYKQLIFNLSNPNEHSKSLYNFEEKRKIWIKSIPNFLIQEKKPDIKNLKLYFKNKIENSY